MTKKNTKFVINGRDRALFSYLYEVKVATSDQIMRDVFTKVSRTVMYRRIKKMAKAGFIKKSGFFDGDKQNIVYSLSKIALLKFILNKNDDHLIKRCQSEAISHDLILNDIRHLLTSKGEIKNYFTENVLWSHASFVNDDGYNDYRDMHADALAVVEKEGRTFSVAIEYEHTLKYTNRYQDLFSRYYSYNINATFYICRDKKILNCVQNVEQIVRGKNRAKVYFALIDDLKANPEMLKFIEPREQKYVSIS